MFLTSILYCYYSSNIRVFECTIEDYDSEIGKGIFVVLQEWAFQRYFSKILLQIETLHFSTFEHLSALSEAVTQRLLYCTTDRFCLFLFCFLLKSPFSERGYGVVCVDRGKRSWSSQT